MFVIEINNKIKIFFSFIFFFYITSVSQNTSHSTTVTGPIVTHGNPAPPAAAAKHTDSWPANKGGKYHVLTSTRDVISSGNTFAVGTGPYKNATNGQVIHDHSGGHDHGRSWHSAAQRALLK